MASNTPYATITELEAFWRTLEPDENTRANTLLAYASNYLRRIAKNNGIDLDEDIAADEALGAIVKMIVLEAVKRAMATPTDAPAATQWSQTASPYSESMTFANPASDLYFKRNELQLLGFGGLSGRSQFGVLSGARGGVCDE